jgi:hypothetical protein
VTNDPRSIDAAGDNYSLARMAADLALADVIASTAR